MAKRRELIKEQTRMKDRREFLITLLNMAAVPLLIIAVGITIAVRRRSLQAAH